uniref:Uncharacterized protein n=1 Tax=Arundo donax TaxID=35708 RepID=A0A0A9ATV4_ARUDO
MDRCVCWDLGTCHQVQRLLWFKFCSVPTRTPVSFMELLLSASFPIHFSKGFCA